MGARIAREDQTLVQLDADAVGHSDPDDVGPDLEAVELVRTEGARQCNVAGIPAPRDQNAPDARGVVARIEGVPAAAEVRLEPAGEVHRSVRRLGRVVAEV